jgi:hypothetical protein
MHGGVGAAMHVPVGGQIGALHLTGILVGAGDRWKFRPKRDRAEASSNRKGTLAE